MECDTRTEPSSCSPRGRAIVLYARSFHALAAIRSLGRRGIEVIAADQYAVTPGRLSRYAVDHFEYPSPTQTTEDFLECLVENVNRFAPGEGVPYVLLPLNSETALIARERKRFEPHIRIPLGDFETFELLGNKVRLAQYARTQGVPVPPTWSPRTSQQLEQRLEEISLPAFIKMPFGSSGAGVTRVETPAELLETFARLTGSETRFGDAAPSTPMIQAAVDGDDYCITALFNRGQPHIVLSYRNVRTFPPGSGPGVLRETVSAPLLEKLTVDLLRSVAWHGVAQVDFRWNGDPEGGAFLLEVNPRLFGGLFQMIVSGVDYPWLLYQLATRQPLDEPEFIELGTRTKAPFVAALSVISELASDEAILDDLGRRWHESVDEIRKGHLGEGLMSLWEGLKEAIEPEARMDHLRRLMQENEESISMLYSEDDPGPLLGLVYPLAIFLRHGKLNAKLLAGGD